MLKKEKGIFYLVVGICVAILIILTIVGILLPKQPYSKGPLSSSLMNSHTSSSQDSEWTEPVSPVSSQAEGGVDGITLSVDQVTLEVGENQMPLVTMTPEDAPDKSEIWVSSDTNVATVDGMGRITGVGGRQLHCHRHQRCQSSSVCHCSGDSFRRHGCHYGDHYAQPAGSHHSCTCPHTCAYAGTYTEPHSFSVGTLSVSGAAAFSAGGAGTLSIGIISAAGLSCSPNGSVFRRVIILVDGVLY